MLYLERNSLRLYISDYLVLRNSIFLVEGAQCGFKAITSQAAHALLPQVKDDEWFFDTELLVRAQQAGMTTLELPVRWAGGCRLDGRHSRHGEEGSGRYAPGQGGYGGPSGRGASRRPGLPCRLGPDPPA